MYESKVENKGQKKTLLNDDKGIKSMNISAVYSKNDSIVKEPFNSARLPQQQNFSKS